MKIWLSSISQIKSPPSHTLRRKVQRFHSACVWTRSAPTGSETDKNYGLQSNTDFMYILSRSWAQISL